MLFSSSTRTKLVGFLWRKVSKHIVAKSHKVPLQSELVCQVLPSLEEKLKEGVSYTRVHDGVKNRRGPYLKADYSFSGAYAQTTLTQKENSTILITAATTSQAQGPFR